MTGLQGVVGEVVGGSQYVPAGRMRIAIDDEINYLNVDKNILFLLLAKAKKTSVGRMKHSWWTQEKKSDIIASTGAATGDWTTGGTSGGLTIGASNAFLVAPNDLLMVPTVSVLRTLYVTACNQSTGVIAAQTVDGSAITITGTPDILLLGSSHESGSGIGTIKTEQPVEEYNYVQIQQTPVGITTTGKHIDYRGVSQWDKDKMENAIDHSFKLEKTFFFGQRDYKATGIEVGTYEQWFCGGLNEFISTNYDDIDGALTETAFGAWVIAITEYGIRPLIFTGAMIFEGLTQWADGKIEITQNETTLGVAMSKYLTSYGRIVPLVPHRQLLKGATLGGMAFGVDMDDVEYRYLKGLDTHVEVGVQDKGSKTMIDEIRTWQSIKVGQEKRHGWMDGVSSITA